MKLETINVRSHPEMVQRHVVHDVKRATDLGDVIGWQEILPERYNETVRRLGKHWDHAHLDLECPISWDTRHWEHVSEGREQLHHGKAKASPNRWLVWVTLRNKHHHRREVTVLNTHYVSGAWNKKKKFAKAWRKRMWRKSFRKMRKIVRGFYKDGKTCVGTGDFNRLHVRKFHKHQHWLSNRGIDKIWYLVGKKNAPRIREIAVHTIKRGWFTDHDGRVAIFGIVLRHKRHCH